MLNFFTCGRSDTLPAISSIMRLKSLGILMVAALSLSACGDQKQPTDKVLAKVDGNEITQEQLDAELLHAAGTSQESGVQPQVRRKQALEALINRQILLKEAQRKQIDRDPKLIQVVARFKTQALVQAYLESKEENMGKPSKAEIDSYFDGHPELFAHRQVLDIEQLVIAASDFDSKLKSEMDTARSLNALTKWLKSHQIGYVNTELTYTSTDLPVEMIADIKKLGKQRIFVMKDGKNDRLCALTELRESPISRQSATAQIERTLLNKKIQDLATEEIARLRVLAKLEYSDKSDHLLVEQNPTFSGLPGKPVPAVQKQAGKPALTDVK